MLEIKLARLTGRVCVAESVELFKITGKRLHNTNSRFRITGFTGHCCDEWVVHLHMSAQVAVIAAVPLESVHPTVLDIAIGDQIRVDYTICELINRRHADPILVAVDHLKRLERKGVTL